MSNKKVWLPLKYKKFDDLKPKYEQLKLIGQDPRMLVKKLDSIYKVAHDNISNGDQENAYICYMKYFSVISFIQKSEDYKKDPGFYKAMFGKRPLSAMNEVEALSLSLMDRYSNSESIKQVIQNNEKNLEIMNDKANGNEIIQPPDMRIKKEPRSTTISSVKLFNMLKDGVTKVLIMDTRSEADFTSSQIKNTENAVINIPDEIIKKGMSANILEQELPVASKELWKVRGTYDQIVLLDWSTTETSREQPKVVLLKEILNKWDVNTNYKNSDILILDGGYDDWLNSYPWYTTNPKPLRPFVEESSNFSHLDQVIYPDLDDDLKETLNQEYLRPFFDRTQKPLKRQVVDLDEVYEDSEDTLENYVQPGDSQSVPSFDRAKKAAAIKTYEERKEDIESLLMQKVIETSEAVELERTMIDKERELNETIQQQKEVEQDEEQLRVLEEKEEKLLIKVEELREESELKDSKIRELQGIIEIYERRDAEDIAKKEKDMERQMKEAEINEQIKLQEIQKEKLAKEREEMEKINEVEMRKQKLEAARKEKKKFIDSPERGRSYHRETAKVIPQINRTNKPRSPPYEEKVRQFCGTKGSVGRGLTGLKNLGNTCYMNSILQCISNNSALAKYFCGNHYREDVNRANKTKGEIAEEVAAVVKTLWSGHFRSIACKDLKFAVGSFKSEYGSYEQQDSHEFLTFLMDWLHNDLNKVHNLNKLEHERNMSDTERAWQDFKKQNESLISTLFYGLQKSTVRCLRCGEESTTYEPFSNLSLIIPDGEYNSLEQCLRLYMKGERISGWRCPKCQELREAEKKTDICKLPPILVIHLKRFHYIQVLSKKRTTYVDFPLNELKMSQFVVNSKQRHTNYDLYGVSNHYGTMEGGHYTAYCKSALFKKWYKFDDHEVVEMSPNEVKTNAAYILFYSSINYQVPDPVS